MGLSGAIVVAGLWSVRAMEQIEEFPPAGMIGRHEAARMFGVSAHTWGCWERQGRVSCGRLVSVAGTGTRVKLYPVEELRQLLEAFHNPAPFPPPGMVDRRAAARMFGTSERTFSTWEKEGRITCGRFVARVGKPGQQKIYSIEELRRLAEEFRKAEEAEKAQPFPPSGFVGRDQACRIFGVAVRTWVTWEQESRITCGQFVPNPGKPGRSKIYPREQLERLAREHKRQAEEAIRKLQPYPDPQRPGCWRVPVSSEFQEGMEAIVDEESLPLVQGERVNWSMGTSGRGSVVLAVGRTFKPLHQLIMGVMGRQYRVGHLNGDPLDCRRENLVVRTPSEQKAATRKMLSKRGKPCSSRFKGVHFNPDGRKWSATITVEGKTRQLGRFLSEIDAALAYDAAARELYGPHARLNFADPLDAERLRDLQPPAEVSTFPPPGMVDVDGACQMFAIPVVTWTAWEQQGRMPLSGKEFEIQSGGHCKLYPVEELNRLQETIRDLIKPYPDPQQPNVYRVPLKSYLYYREAIVDAESLPLVEGRHWQWQARSDGVGGGQVILSQRGISAPLARFVAEVADTAGMNTRVSHRNGDPLDCRRVNLNLRTMQQQLFGNRKLGTVNGRKYTSKFKGVSWDKRRERWLANISKNCKMYRLGSFRDELAAAQAYDEAAREFFGEYARLNFPDGIDAALERQAREAA
jgi:DNA-binding transcriptional MerR regulator